MTWQRICEEIGARIEGRPTAAEIRRTPEFRAAFMRALARFIYDRCVTRMNEQDVESVYQAFVAGQNNTYDFYFHVNMVIGDTVFMPYLYEETQALRDGRVSE